MTNLHAGAVLDRLPGPKYATSLDFAELEFATPLPKVSTVRRWCEGRNKKVTLSLVAPKAATYGSQGPLRIDDEVTRAITWTKGAVEALNARFLVLPTDGRTTTSAKSRQRIREWFAHFEDLDTQLVWHPTGLWDPELAIPFAKELNVLWAFDPLEMYPPEGDNIYARLQAIGMRNKFTETLLLEVADSIGQSEALEAWVGIHSPKSFREASRLAELARDLHPEG